MSDKQWYALRTKSHKEKGVESLLLEKNLEAFLPILKVKPANPRSRKWKTLFPALYPDVESHSSIGSFGLISMDVFSKVGSPELMNSQVSPPSNVLDKDELRAT